MSSGSIEERLNRLEQKVHELEHMFQPDTVSPPWWNRVAGAFKDDSVYAEAMQLARDERDAVSSLPISRNSEDVPPRDT